MGETGSIIESRDELVAHLESGCKPKSEWRLGTEHEKFCYYSDSLKPVSYGGPAGIRALLEGLQRFGWSPVMEGDNIIALVDDAGASVSLEPAGQLELSGAKLTTIHETCDEVHTHLAQAKEVGEELGIHFLGIGFHPLLKREDAPIMPKQRYDIMRAYMQTKGNLGLDMMLRTTTVQVNLDFDSEADMVRKIKTSLALQPVATALFANSPFTEGKPNGFKSYRSHVWTDTDPDRTGLLPFVFEDGFGFERWVDYALDVPMYFVYRDGVYIDASGLSFRDFLAGRLSALPGEKPTLNDWQDHLTTIFPEVRLKTFLEMRGADGGPWSRLCALPAFWAGLLYDSNALSSALDLTRDWTMEEIADLRSAAAKNGLAGQFRGQSLQSLAHSVLEISDCGLLARANLSGDGESEQTFLEPLWASVETGQTPADELLAKFAGEWGGDITRAFEDLAY